MIYTWVLGTKQKSTERAINTLNHSATSPAPQLVYCSPVELKILLVGRKGKKEGRRQRERERKGETESERGRLRRKSKQYVD